MKRIFFIKVRQTIGLNMKKLYFMVLFIGAILIYGGIISEGQTKKNLENNWNLNEIQVTISKSILGGEPGFEVKRTAEKRIFIEVTGWVTAKNLEKASIKIPQITLSGSSIKDNIKITWKVNPHGIGMVIGQNRYYELPDTIVKGRKTVEHKVSGKYSFGKSNKEDEAIFILLNNPTHICLAFIVPEKTENNLKLVFGDRDFILKLPDTISQ